MSASAADTNHSSEIAPVSDKRNDKSLQRIFLKSFQRFVKVIRNFNQPLGRLLPNLGTAPASVTGTMRKEVPSLRVMMTSFTATCSIFYQLC